MTCRIIAAFMLACTLLLSCATQSTEQGCRVHPDTTQPQRGRVLSSDGVPIAYYAQGKGEPALIFIHGGFVDSNCWSEQVDPFAEDHLVVTVDLAGHGASGKDRAPWTLQAFAEDLMAVSDDLHIQRAILIGHSMGGPISLRAAQLMPDRVIGIVAVDTLLNADIEWDEEAWKKRTEMFRNDFFGTLDAMKDQVFQKNADPELVAMVMDRLRRTPPELAISIMEAFNSYDMASEMQAVKAPIRGLNADLWPTNIDGNRKYAPKFDAIIMKGVGHYLMLERPEEFNHHLAEILKDML